MYFAKKKPIKGLLNSVVNYKMTETPLKTGNAAIQH